MGQLDGYPPREPTVEERARWEAEARKFDAETRKADAEALHAANVAEGSAIGLAREQRLRALELASDDRHHVYRFVSTVDAGSVKTCIAALQSWSRVDTGCPITIVFTSPGGEVISGMALFDFITELRGQGHTVTTVARGYAASMAGILLQAGDVRVMGHEAWLMIHEASFGASGSMGEVEDTVEWVKKVQDRILDIFAARSTLSKVQLRSRWRRKNWWIPSDEALRLGLIDEIR